MRLIFMIDLRWRINLLVNNFLRAFIGSLGSGLIMKSSHLLLNLFVKQGLGILLERFRLWLSRGNLLNRFWLASLILGSRQFLTLLA